MITDKFAEINLEIDDSTMASLYETAITSKYSNRSILLNYLELPNMKLNPIIDDFVERFNCSFSIMRFEPACYVIWHLDLSPFRKCVINVPLKSYKDQLTFITDQDIPHSFETRNAIPTEEDFAKKTARPYIVPYKYKKLYMLNVSEKYHCVFNTGDEYRYVFAIMTGNITHSQGLDYFTNLGLVNQ